jgi:hypothetical protein
MVSSPILMNEAYNFSRQVHPEDPKKSAAFARRLLDIYTLACEKEVLLVHNPGGWGRTYLDHCQQWEKNIVHGIEATLEKLGYNSLLIQYFRTDGGVIEVIRDIKEQIYFFNRKAKILSNGLEFLTSHLKGLTVILLGVSQGATFANAVMQKSNGLSQVFSIELGMMLPFSFRRKLTERTLSIDGNGEVPDALTQGNLIIGFRAFVSTPFRWIIYRLKGKRVKFTYCINVPGHNYDWLAYPQVRQKVENFLHDILPKHGKLK